MPMYFPDLDSIKALAETMSKNKGEKAYRGVIPQTETELPEARKQLAQYMRKVWNDEIFAMEIELAVDVDNYDQKMGDYIRRQFGG